MDTDSTQKLLVVNADDLGMSTGVNRGIFEAHERGIVTSASLMVRWAGAREAAAARLGAPLRHEGRVLYCGDFYGQDEHGLAYHDGICADALARIVRATRAGMTELACHPGYDDGLETMYRDERAMEVAALCDQRVRRAVEESGVRLVNFGEVG